MSDDKIMRYYQRMPPEFRRLWDRLSPDQQKAVFPSLDKFHETMETATWNLLAGFIKALLK